MRLLVDTHCWLWALACPERLNPEARRLLDDPASELLFSSASAWEISIKHAIRKLTLPCSPELYVTTRMAAMGMIPLPIHVAHALRAGGLPPHHKDPFDRLLIAQAQLEEIPVVTADPQFRAYDVHVLWAA